MVKGLFISALLLGMATSAFAETVLCPAAKQATPAIATMGPYKTIGYKTTTASTVGLPNCIAAEEALNRLVDALPSGSSVLVKIEAEKDGTYTASVQKI